jgi:hypothetical protein
MQGYKACNLRYLSFRHSTLADDDDNDNDGKCNKECVVNSTNKMQKKR